MEPMKRDFHNGRSKHQVWSVGAARQRQTPQLSLNFLIILFSSLNLSVLKALTNNTAKENKMCFGGFI